MCKLGEIQTYCIRVDFKNIDPWQMNRIASNTVTYPFDFKEWLIAIFSLQWQYNTKQIGIENKEHNHPEILCWFITKFFEPTAKEMCDNL